MRKLWNIILWGLVLGGILFLLSFAGSRQQSAPCASLQITVDNPDGNNFIAEEDIREIINDLGYDLSNDQSCHLDIAQIEQVLNSHPCIDSANVYTTINSAVKVSVMQRVPIIRVFSTNGDSYYIDANGWLMPLSDKFTSRSLVANGAINEPYVLRYHTNMRSLISSNDTSSVNMILLHLYTLADFIYKDPFWRSQIVQVFVNEERELELIPRVGNHSILLGGVDHLEEKFDKLMIFYKEGLAKTGWNEYKTINLKYKDQVICSKN